MQSHAITVPDLILADTYDTWFKKWPDRAPHDLIGGTPEAASLAATGVRLPALITLGMRLWDHTKAGQVQFTVAEIEESMDDAALGLMRNAASHTVGEYRKRLAQERRRGMLAHRRYTFTERPLLRLDDDTYIALRPAWVLDRFCGSQLYWQTFFDLGTEKDPKGEQFSQAMNYVFEGVCEHRNSRGFVDLIAKWREMCTNGMPIRPQTFLDLTGLDRPMSNYPAVARSRLINALQGDA